MVENVILLLLAAIPLMGSPGPATLSTAAAASVFGIKRSLPYLTGIMLGTATVIAIVATGITGVLFAVPGVLPVLTVGAFGYILYLAYKIATAPVLSEATGNAAPPTLLGGLFLGISNPKAFAAIGAVFSSFVVMPGEPVLDAVVKFTVMLAIVTPINISWLLLGASLSRILRHPRTGRAINIVFAVLLVLSVALAVLV
ncbi:MAG: LysE family translocator [Rhodospirillaceae bacterium]|jgi:threonine/homoserine/homoserine lactone efflux protein|nr:LysE family translocator [Rhodospirillaceae bacterium]MBT3491345.1 LysE family translocator [Rhodospirillaceae bacterium]MBT3779774.1 LysE family translocator [Rhodospirillaceae bacterium]MBT3974820.1 LysE family translocator [Rhodospirillaceae bacterium]MBT4563453.1 LysE family translocator [Rhodospirillaceae bacterium]